MRPLIPEFLQDISITTAPVPTVLYGATSRGVLWQAAPGRFLLDLPDVARYLVEHGERITVEPAAGVSSDSVIRFGRMTPLAALLYQRGILAFHAAVVTNGTGALLLAGDSGSGKSTLLMALQQRGWIPVSDELAVVALNDKGALQLYPTFPECALWPETIRNFGRESEEFHHADANRLLVPFSEQHDTFPHLLRSIYWLGVQHKNEITRSELFGLDLFRGTGMMLYNSHVAAALLDRANYMRYVATLIKTVSVTRLLRPRGSWSVECLADLIEKDMA
ncbi:MAG: hypothetical protein ACOYL3_23325 [Desulfuromonadaceae bacterium]